MGQIDGIRFGTLIAGRDRLSGVRVAPARMRRFVAIIQLIVLDKGN